MFKRTGVAMLYVGADMCGLIEGQMHSLSLIACAHMHCTRMCGCMQHAEVWHRVVDDAALPVFQTCPRIIF